VPRRPQIRLEEVRPGTRAAFWREAIAAWAESGLGQAEFCRVRGLRLETFRRYRTTLAKPATGSRRRTKRPLPVKTSAGLSFVEVPMKGAKRSSPPAPAPRFDALEVVLDNGRRIRVGAGFDHEVLAEVVRVLEALPC